MSERLGGYAAAEAELSDYQLAMDAGLVESEQSWADKMEQLEQLYGERVFTYKQYSGTVRDLAACPEFAMQLEQGVDAAAGWLERHDGTPEDIVEEVEVSEEETTQTAEDDEPAEQPDEPAVERVVPAGEEADEPVNEPSLAAARSDGQPEVLAVSADTDGTTEAVQEAPVVIAERPVAELVSETVPAAIEQPAWSDVESAVTADVAEPADRASEPVNVPVAELLPDEQAPEPVLVAATAAESDERVPRIAEQASASPEIVPLLAADDTDTEAVVVAADHSRPEADTAAVYDEMVTVTADEPAIEAGTAPTSAELVENAADAEPLAEDYDFYQPDDMPEAEPAAAFVAEPSYSEASEQLPIAIEQVLETEAIIEDDRAVTAGEEALPVELIELAGEQPDTEPISDTAELQQRAEAVIAKVEVLERARTAEDCRDAVAELRAELAALLLLMGYTNADQLADRLVRQYDTRHLQKHMLAIIQALSSPEHVPPYQVPRTQVAPWRKCASHVLNLVMRHGLPDAA